MDFQNSHTEYLFRCNFLLDKTRTLKTSVTFKIKLFLSWISQKLQIKDNSSEKIKRRRKQTNLSPEERLVNQRHRSVPFKSALLLLMENRHLKERHSAA